MFREELAERLERNERVGLHDRKVGDVSEQLERLVLGGDVEHREAPAVTGKYATGLELPCLLPLLHLLADFGAEPSDVRWIDEPGPGGRVLAYRSVLLKTSVPNFAVLVSVSGERTLAHGAALSPATCHARGVTESVK